MIKQSVTNYLKCLKYVFTPLGIIALGFVCGLSIAIPGIISSVSDMCKSITDTLGNILSDNADAFKTLFDNIVTSVSSLDWSDTAAALQTIFTKQWFETTVLNDLALIAGDIDSYMVQVEAAISACINAIILYVVVVAVFTAVALILSVFLTRRMIRGDIAKRSFIKFITSSLFSAIIWPLCIGLGVWLAVLWKNSIYLSAVIIFILACVASLLSAYVVHGRKKVKLRSVVNIKNVFKLILSDLIIFAIGMAIVVLVSLLTNIIVGVFVGIGIVLVTVSVMELNSESYVNGMAAIAAINSNKADHPLYDLPEQDNTNGNAQNSESADTPSVE